MYTVPRAEMIFPEAFKQHIELAQLGWLPGMPLHLDGLIFLCLLAKQSALPIVEFGTHEGRTAYNLQLNLRNRVATVDLGKTGSDYDYGDYKPGRLVEGTAVDFMIGDSQSVPLGIYEGRCSLIFIDGGHDYETVKSDIGRALGLIAPGGLIVWDDYCEDWPGVVRAIDEFDRAGMMPVYHFVHERLVVAGRGLPEAAS